MYSLARAHRAPFDNDAVEFLREYVIRETDAQVRTRLLCATLQNDNRRGGVYLSALPFGLIYDFTFARGDDGQYIFEHTLAIPWRQHDQRRELHADVSLFIERIIDAEISRVASRGGLLLHRYRRYGVGEHSLEHHITLFDHLAAYLQLTLSRQIE